MVPWDSLLLINKPVDALLTEYIPSDPLTFFNITPSIAETVLETLKVMHSKRVQLGDSDNPHILLKKDNRVTFVSHTDGYGIISS